MAKHNRRDGLIEFIKEELFHGFALCLPTVYPGIMQKIETMIEEHRLNPESSRLKMLVGASLGSFHTSLPLQEAWMRYDLKYCVSARHHIPPSFNEVRHTMNLAQIMASAPSLKMICFDGDGTLYLDGENFSFKPLAATICLLLAQGIYIVLVTAAGYGLDGGKYEVICTGCYCYADTTHDR